MLIKSITLKNFRQYIDTTIEFAMDPDKNITIVMGDNGTGKTTFAQAFQWALYGKTQFQIAELINRAAREQMTMGQSKIVSVAIEILYNEKMYTVKRSVVYKKINQTKYEETDHKFTIATMDENGQMQFLPDGRKNYMIRQFLPEDLSKFFFFDGERIEEMSKEIQSGKSEDFKEAVYSLVGLRGTQNAIAHLKGVGGRNTVIKYYKTEMEKNSKSAKEMEARDKRIQELQEEIEKKQILLDMAKEKHEKCKEEIKECEKTIYSETPKIKLKNDYEKLQKKISDTKQKREIVIGKELLKEFSKGFYDFCAIPLVEQVAPEIKKEVTEEKSIPDLSRRTILHLLEHRKECLCGADIHEGTDAYENLKRLLEYAQPKSISMLLNDYQNYESNLKRHENTYISDMNRKYRQVSELEAQISGDEQVADDMMDQLGNTSKGEEAKAKKKYLEGELSKLHETLVKIEAIIQNYTTEINREENAKDSLVIINEDTMKYKKLLAYAERLFEDFRDEYTRSENKYRNLLEQRMNQIFNVIYDGSIKISIDPKYRISVQIQEEFAAEDELEKNTAQGYALIFAFISAIIDLAKEKTNHNAFEESDMIDTEKEGYPLIMDAPLSAFDKTRIKSICTEIPKIADQVIMFIKDTDGDIAKEHMNNKIGKKYMIQKVNGSNIHSEVIGGE